MLVYERTPATWVQVARLVPPVGPQGYGRSIALEGDRLVVGASGDYPNYPSGGELHVYHRQAGGWVLASTHRVSDAGLYDQLGAALDIDGDRVIAGAPYDDQAGTDEGAAHIFGVDVVNGEGGGCPAMIGPVIEGPTPILRVPGCHYSGVSTALEIERRAARRRCSCSVQRRRPS